MFISKDEKLQIKERLDNIGRALVETSERANEALAAAEKAQEGIPNIRKTNKSLMDNIWNLDAKIARLDTIIESLNAKIVNFKSTETLVTGLAEQSKTMRMRIAELEKESKTFDKNDKTLFASVAALGRRKSIIQSPKKVVIPVESVQALKESGVWDDPTRRIGFIDQLIKEEQEKKIEEKKERQRQHARNYYLRKKAERLAKETA